MQAFLARSFFVLIFLFSACDDFATPAQLETSQVIAVIAEPPIVRPGESSTLSVVIAGPQGELVGLPARWENAATFAGSLPLGTVVANQDGTATYNAPVMLSADTRPIATVALSVEAPEGTLLAVKAIGIADLDSSNPHIDAIEMEGNAAPDMVTVAKGSTLSIGASVSPTPSEDATYAWYATFGEIERYQSSPTELFTGEAATRGWLFAVTRDGRGGIAWKKIAVTVE